MEKRVYLAPCTEVIVVNMELMTITGPASNPPYVGAPPRRRTPVF